MNKLVTGAMVGILSVVLIGCSGESSEPKKVDSENTEASADKEKADKESAEKNDLQKDKVFAIGDSVKKEGKIVTVTGVKRSQGTDMDTPDKGNEYVIVSVQIENQGEDNISFNPFNYSLKNAQGQISDQSLTLIAQDTALNSGELAPEGSISGTMVFQAPADSTDKDLTLLLKDNMFSDENIKINLASK